jgi:hypothetical protein
MNPTNEQIAGKTCNDCGTFKGVDEFYKWNESKCKHCRIKQVAHYQKRPEVRKARALAIRTIREQTPRPPENHRPRKSRFVYKNRASSTLNNAVYRGDIIKPVDCSDCGKTGVEITGHHPDYSKPLEVVWLCRKCHGKRHRKY